MHNLHFKLKHKIAEDEFVELLKDNVNSRMGGLLLTSPITSLAELKREGLRVDRKLRNTGRNTRSRAAVNEIGEFQTQSRWKNLTGSGKTHECVMRMDKDAEAHYTVCHKCGKGADFKFHDATCRFCEKVGTDADANQAAFARNPSGKTGIAGWTRTNPFR